MFRFRQLVESILCRWLHINLLKRLASEEQLLYEKHMFLDHIYNTFYRDVFLLDRLFLLLLL